MIYFFLKGSKNVGKRNYSGCDLTGEPVKRIVPNRLIFGIIGPNLWIMKKNAQEQFYTQDFDPVFSQIDGFEPWLAWMQPDELVRGREVLSNHRTKPRSCLSNIRHGIQENKSISDIKCHSWKCRPWWKNCSRDEKTGTKNIKPRSGSVGVLCHV